MLKKIALATAVLALAAPLAFAPAQAGYGKSAKKAAGTVVDVAAGNPDFSTLVSALKAADLVGTLSGKGPFTVFAPDNAAFGKLPAGTVENLVQPAQKATLTSILTYHVVAGKVKAADLVGLIRKGGGKAVVKTVNGGTLTASMAGSAVVLTDAKGGTSTIKMTDLAASNGVVHVIDTVVMP
jgi:uncharacterized surface protein with fasciclin (FAS1) repeats